MFSDIGHDRSEKEKILFYKRIFIFLFMYALTPKVKVPLFKFKTYNLILSLYFIHSHCFLRLLEIHLAFSLVGALLTSTNLYFEVVLVPPLKE